VYSPHKIGLVSISAGYLGITVKTVSVGELRSLL